MKITLQDLQRQIRRGPGLVIGPAISSSLSRESDCLIHLKAIFPGFDAEAIAPTYLDYADLILASGKIPYLKLRNEIEQHFNNVAFVNPQLQTIVNDPKSIAKAAYLREAFELVKSASKSPGDELVICRIELIVNWQVNSNKGPVFWEQFEQDLLHILHKPRYASDSMWTFYLAVAQYNSGKFSDAEGNFQSLRSRNLPWPTRHLIRCFYLGDKAVPKILEGKIAHGSHERYIFSSELANDVQIRKGQFEDRPDELKHFKIGFTFYGPIGVDRTF